MAIGLAGPATSQPGSVAIGSTTPVLYPAGSGQADYVASGFVPEIWL